VVSPATPLGKIDLDLVAEDKVNHVVKGKVSFMVVLPPADPIIIGTDIEPNTVPNDGKTQCDVTAAVSDPNGDIVSVVADLSKVGGAESVQMKDDGKGADKRSGDGIWSVRFTVPSTVLSGSRDIDIKVTDSTDRYVTSKVSLRVEQSNKPPEIKGYETGLTDNKVRIGETISVKVNASDPEGRIARVEMDLSELSLGTVELLDDGTGDDEIQGDGVFSGSIRLTGNLSGNYNITIRVVDERGDDAVVIFQIDVEGSGSGPGVSFDITIIAIAGTLFVLLLLASIFAYSRSGRMGKTSNTGSPGAQPPIFRPMSQQVAPGRFTPVGGAGPR
jgi:hypothetical protein